MNKESIILISLNICFSILMNINVLIIKVYLLNQILLGLHNWSFMLVILMWWRLASLSKITNFGTWLIHWFMMNLRALDWLILRIEDWWSSLNLIACRFFLGLTETIQICLSNSLLNRLSNISLKYRLIKINNLCLS